MKHKKISILAVLALMMVSTAQAQVGKRYYIDLGWQFNGAFSNTFSENASGWGAYAEGGYYFLPRMAAGAFVSFNTNNDYIPKDTYVMDDGSSVTTDMYRSLFQIPFGATLRYRFTWTRLQPYLEAKIGANYARETQLYSTASAYSSQWGFYISPEAGVSWHPFHRSDIGFQLSVYYSYATNREKALKLSGINNAGFKLGIAF